MKYFFALFVLIFLSFLTAFPQEKSQSPFGIQISGYVKNDFFWDSRQVSAARQGHFLLYPLNEQLDKEGNDINARSAFNFMAIQTRFTIRITGPDAFKAKTSGYIEGEFFGMSETNVNGFRLRHAIIMLTWPKSMLMLGQYWHPMFNTNCFPETVSFNTGAPFIPFTRNPQIRFRRTAGKFNLYATAYSQIDFMSNGPQGPNSVYLRNSAVPGLNAMIEYSSKFNENQKELLIALTGNFKTLVPRLVSDSGYKTQEKVPAFAAGAYIKYKWQPMTIKAGATWGEDLFDFTMLGGYAVHEIIDPQKAIVSYSPMAIWSAWTDLQTNGTRMQFGLFAAYSGNMGASENIMNKYFYGRGNDIAYAYRLAPRFIYDAGKFRIAPEIEYTVAAYGKPDEKGKVIDYKEIGNLRFLLGIFYFF